MKYLEICRLYESLESTTKRLEKTALLSEFLAKTPVNLLRITALLAQGRVFPSWSEKEIGVASKLMLKAIAKATGVPEKDVTKKVKTTGDYGLSAEHYVAKKRQQTLMSKPLELKEVHEKLEKLAGYAGSGSVERKLAGISELLGRAEPLEARYLVRTILEEMRIGVASGVIRDATASAFKVPVEAVEHAYETLNDWGEVALIAKEQGEKGLLNLELKPGRPFRVMLAQKAASITDAIETLGKCALEYKYDGMRMQIHKSKDGIKIFTRRLDELTKQFPDIVEAVTAQVSAKTFIIEGEAVATDPKTGALLPFQQLSRRIKRKHDIQKTREEIPCVLHLFDLNYLDGKSYLEEPFEKRRKTLESIVKESKELALAKQLITDDPKKAEAFFKEALDKGQEGLMAKNLSAPYKPGSRVGNMLKIKTTMENLDLVIVGAEWGEGRRAKWLASLLLACKGEDDYLTIGKLGTGLTDEQFKEMTEALKPLILEEKGKEAKIRPKIVIEVAYEEIQKSPTYTSGFALRFPRMVQVRDDKGPEDASEIEFVSKLYEIQRGR